MDLHFFYAFFKDGSKKAGRFHARSAAIMWNFAGHWKFAHTQELRHRIST